MPSWGRTNLINSSNPRGHSRKESAEDYLGCDQYVVYTQSPRNTERRTCCCPGNEKVNLLPCVQLNATTVWSTRALQYLACTWYAYDRAPWRHPRDESPQTNCYQDKHPHDRCISPESMVLGRDAQQWHSIRLCCLAIRQSKSEYNTHTHTKDVESIGNRDVEKERRSLRDRNKSVERVCLATFIEKIDKNGETVGPLRCHRTLNWKRLPYGICHKGSCNVVKVKQDKVPRKFVCLETKTLLNYMIERRKMSAPLPPECRRTGTHIWHLWSLSTKRPKCGKNTMRSRKMTTWAGRR